MSRDRFPTFLTEVDDDPTVPVPTHQCIPGCVCRTAHAAADRLHGAARFLELGGEMIARDSETGRPVITLRQQP